LTQAGPPFEAWPASDALRRLAVVWAWWQSKRESDELKRIDEEFAKAAQG